MKRNQLAAMVLALLLTFSLVACASPAAPPDAAATTFTVGFDAEFAPYGYQDADGNYVGFDLDLAAAVCEAYGWELVKQPIAWDSKDMELSSGNIDCIWNGFTMDAERLPQYTWSKPYMDNSQVFVVTAESGIKTQADLAGKAVVVQADSSALSALNNQETPDVIALRDSFSSLTEVPDYLTAFMNLESGAAEAIAIDVGVAQYQMNQRDGDFVILDPPLASEVYAIGFKLGNEALRDQVQTALDKMGTSGKVAEIAAKYADVGISAEAITLGK